MSEHFRARRWPNFGEGMQAAKLEPVGWHAERRIERGGENAIKPDEVCECPHRASARPSGEPKHAACGIECGETLDIGLDPIGGRHGRCGPPLLRRPARSERREPKRARSVVEELSSMVGGDNRTSAGVGDRGELGEGRGGGVHGRVLRSVQRRHSG